MSEAIYQMKLLGNPADGTPAIDAEFGRITVLIGANGSGKSKVLKSIVENAPTILGGPRPVTYVEGGRVMRVPDRIASGIMPGDSLTPHDAEVRVKQQKGHPNSSSRIDNILRLLRVRSVEARLKHSDAVTKWQESASSDPVPVVEANQLEELFIGFSEVFPEITLSLDEKTLQLWCVKGGSKYGPENLSDGERQVFFMLADIALTTEPGSLIVVAEPELNLNPLLADRLWNMLEVKLSDAVFVYGTHSISFGMRRSVNRVIALSGRGQPSLPIKDISDIPQDEAREFLGAIPAILSAQAAIGVEGTDASFDEPIYKWLVRKPEVAVVPLGGSSDVIGAVARSGIWDRLAPTAKLVGIVDRDYRSDDDVTSKDKVIILEYHEIESYFCHPKLLSELASALGTATPLPSAAAFEDLLLEYFNKMILRIAVKRMAARAQISLNVSPQAGTIKLLDETNLRKLIEKEAATEEAKAKKYMGPVKVISIFSQELTRCQKAVADKDVNEVLTLAPGKELLELLAKHVGCANAAMVARAAIKHIDISRYSHLDALRTKILAALPK